jgi:hypothetical protein
VNTNTPYKQGISSLIATSKHYKMQYGLGHHQVCATPSSSYTSSDIINKHDEEPFLLAKVSLAQSNRLIKVNYGFISSKSYFASSPPSPMLIANDN